MNWEITIIILVIGGYLFYKSSQKNNPLERIERLESLAEQLYSGVVKKVEQEVEGGKKSGSLLGLVSETKKKELMKNDQNRLKEIKDFKHNYTRLKERNKHEPNERKLALAQDYFDYYYTRTKINDGFRNLDFVDNKGADDIFEEMHELDIKAEEIVKRFNNQIAS